MTKPNVITRLTILGAAILALSLVGMVFGLAWPPAVEAGATLPPREQTATPASKERDRGKDVPVGAYIELEIQPAQVGLWTAVQWQDSAGGWHKVEGWQGPPEGSSRQWWVEAKDFGKGPFRWAVMRGQNGALAGVSEIFNLPAGAGQRVQVTVVLK